MLWYSHGCNDGGCSYFTRKICNQCIDSLKILFGATSEACSAIVTTIWRPGFKRVLKLSTYRLQVFLVKYEYLRSLQLCEDQGIRGSLKKPVCKHVLAILTTYIGDQALSLALKISNKEDLKDFEAMKEKRLLTQYTFHFPEWIKSYFKVWFPLDRNAIVESYDSSMFWFITKRLMRTYHFFCVSGGSEFWGGTEKKQIW